MITRNLKPGTGIVTKVFPYDKGAILEFKFGINEKNVDEIRTPSYTLQDALKRSQLQVSRENSTTTTTTNYHFRGTNIIMSDNKIYLIKDMSEDEWTDEKVEEDVDKILHSD